MGCGYELSSNNLRKHESDKRSDHDLIHGHVRFDHSSSWAITVAEAEMSPLWARRRKKNSIRFLYKDSGEDFRKKSGFLYLDIEMAFTSHNRMRHGYCHSDLEALSRGYVQTGRRWRIQLKID